MEKSRILIIEDNPDTRRFLEVMLAKEFEVISAENAVIGIDFARNKSPDLILLDIMLPILSGYDACSLLKKDEKTRNIPIIFLSAKNTVTDITQGLSVGADDYIPKPFDYKELKARISTRLRKSDDQGAKPITVGELKIEPSTREVFFAGKKAHLTLTEFDILKCLAARAGNVISRDEILKEVWKEDSTGTNDRTIDVHVRALRRKMPALTKFIISIYGVGYKYET
ncbi:MAG: response regulator transcription factor [Xanthomonadaceae bacterium]|nr:response regulator transcription factor [Xanthomonadaceae bacterium]